MNHIFIWLIGGLCLSWIILFVCMVLFFILVKHNKIQEIEVEASIRKFVLPENRTPLKKLPQNYSPTQAWEDGCVVVEGDQMTSGMDIWESFVQNKEQLGFVRIVCYEKEEYIVHDLWKKEKEYKVEYLENNKVIWDEYSYLNCYETETGYIEYALGTKEGLTYKDWERYIFSGSDMNGVKFYKLFSMKK